MSKRIWYCCVVKSAMPLMTRINGSHFRAGQHGYCSQDDETTWLLFDGHRYACVLTTDLAKAALETRRDSQNRRVLAPAETEERFQRSVYGQTGRRTRKERRFW